MFILKYIAIHDLIKNVKNYMLDPGVSLFLPHSYEIYSDIT